MGFFNKLLGKTDTSQFKKRLKNWSELEVEDDMTSNVVTVSPDEKLVDAANIMIGEHISGLVVEEFDTQKPVGIITERDFLRQTPQKTEEMKETPVSDIMTTDVVTVHPSLSLTEVSDLMNKHKFRKVVVTENEKLVGIITQTDLVSRMDEFYQGFKFKTSDSLNVRKVMKEAITVKADATIEETHEKMIDNNTGSIYVVDDDLVGTFTEFDFLSQLALNPEEMQDLKMKEVMSFPLVAVDSEVDLFDANRLMLDKGFRRLPVIEDEEMIGKVTQTTVRKNGFEILEKSLERSEEDNLKAVNFGHFDKSKSLVRDIQGKTQKFVYPT